MIKVSKCACCGRFPCVEDGWENEEMTPGEQLKAFRETRIGIAFLDSLVCLPCPMASQKCPVRKP